MAAHVALELMRNADEEARELIDAMLDALGMLGGTAADEIRPLRPLAWAWRAMTENRWRWPPECPWPLRPTDPTYVWA